MATYNGADYVGDQLESILEQLRAEDEVVIIDDSSTDDTVQMLRRFADRRVRVIESSENTGHVRAFERALREARGDVILLSDQDDIWLPGRVELMINALTSSNYVASNWRPLDAEVAIGPRISSKDTATPWRNVARIFAGSLPYFGCAMGVRRETLAQLLPFPPQTEAHDHWIALVGNVGDGIRHLEQDTVARRLHANNLTPRRRRTLVKVVKTRLILASLLWEAVVRRVRLTRAERASL